jgi:hypothetical protein
MRGRCVDDAGAVIADHRHRFARRIVGQAEDHEIGVVQRFAPRGGILAARVVERDQREFARPARRSAISRPVVPAAPSMKTVFAISYRSLLYPLTGGP